MTASWFGGPVLNCRSITISCAMLNGVHNVVMYDKFCVQYPRKHHRLLATWYCHHLIVYSLVTDTGSLNGSLRMTDTSGKVVRAVCIIIFLCLFVSVITRKHPLKPWQTIPFANHVSFLTIPSQPNRHLGLWLLLLLLLLQTRCWIEPDKMNLRHEKCQIDRLVTPSLKKSCITFSLITNPLLCFITHFY